MPEESKDPLRRADYGLDAPGVVRNLALVAAAGLILAALIGVGLLPDSITLRTGSGLEVKAGLLGLGLGPGLGCAAAAIAMVWSSRVGKLQDREHLLDTVPWNGTESVLDIGCGRGLMLVASARRLTSGRAVGIDLWRGEDLAGNRPEATLENAAAEGVASTFQEEGCTPLRRLDSPVGASFWTLLTFGSLRPGAWLIQRPV